MKLTNSAGRIRGNRTRAGPCLGAKPHDEAVARTGKGAVVQPLFPALELSEHERKVLETLSTDVPAHVDQLLLSTGLGSADLMNALLGLEMKDRIRELPGKSFIKRL